MPQKLCSTCQKELTPTERALGEIQCTACYRHWLSESVAQAEPMIRQMLEELRQERKAPASPHV